MSNIDGGCLSLNVKLNSCCFSLRSTIWLLQKFSLSLKIFMGCTCCWKIYTRCYCILFLFFRSFYNTLNNNIILLILLKFWSFDRAILIWITKTSKKSCMCCTQMLFPKNIFLICIKSFLFVKQIILMSKIILWFLWNHFPLRVFLNLCDSQTFFWVLNCELWSWHIIIIFNLRSIRILKLQIFILLLKCSLFFVFVVPNVCFWMLVFQKLVFEIKTILKMSQWHNIPWNWWYRSKERVFQPLHFFLLISSVFCWRAHHTDIEILRIWSKSMLSSRIFEFFFKNVNSIRSLTCNIVV